ncbi:hypothetical protein M9H77_06216 [Catharanthus roseus]|uniref:Uncharacterized protein n=1 Tax=Catharanthus roseus TaxID=4058 RepID=A0ACC0BRN9_CATRO|nr:hypothetical protein M9H77_06216 [Catharanthus roseus]
MQEGRGTTSNARQRDGQSLIGPKKAEENHRGKRTKAQLPEPVSVSASKGADSGGSKMAESGGDRPTADQIHSETRQEHPDSVSLEDALANITGGPTRSAHRRSRSLDAGRRLGQNSHEAPDCQLTESVNNGEHYTDSRTKDDGKSMELKGPIMEREHL